MLRMDVYVLSWRMSFKRFYKSLSKLGKNIMLETSHLGRRVPGSLSLRVACGCGSLYVDPLPAEEAARRMDEEGTD